MDVSVMETTDTSTNSTSSRIAVEFAMHGHRDNFTDMPPQECAVRLR